ncbi:MAG: multicopper oxidase domain-containing protein [Thermodesulfobacteriota bacterium]
MYNFRNGYRKWVVLLAALLPLVFSTTAQAVIEGISGAAGTPVFNLRAKSGHISTGDGSSVLFWGYGDDGGPIGVQYPGPTMMVNEGDLVTVNLVNELSEATSIVFPGQEVTASGGVPGLLTREAPPDRLTTVTYTFTANQPGTFTYYSGTRPDLQVEMGMVGALIVYPATANTAYGDARSAYDYEYLFLLTEMDPLIHDQVEFGQMSSVNTATAKPVLWFINGRNGPDTLGNVGDPTLPTQPYNIIPRLNPGGRLLSRVIGAGRDLHPFHFHGNNFDLIARDGRFLESAPAAQKNGEVGILPDLAVSDFTLTVAPGATYDTIFTWTGKDLGWDIYGDGATHTCTPDINGFDFTTYEWCDDHNKPFPVTLPSTGDITPGAMYSGSPFLGAAGFLPPGEGGNNPNSGFFYMWHSHNEREIINFDIFPGGMLTFLIVEPPNVVIP